MTDDERQRRIDAIKPPPGDSGPLHSYTADRKRLAREIGDDAERWMRAHERQPLKFDENDVRDALPDAFLLRSGMSVRNAHPMAKWCSELSLARLAEQCRAGVTTTDFAGAMSHGFSRVVTTIYDTIDRAGPCVHDMEVKDFKPVDLVHIDLTDLSEVVRDGGNGIAAIPLQLLSTAGSETGSIQSYRRRLLVSRPMLLSDDFGAISAALQQLSAQAGRLPLQKIGDILTLNANLAIDDQPLIGGDNTAAPGINSTGLSSAMSILRLTISEAGNVLNQAASVWILRPENELAARSTLFASGLLGSGGIQISVNPWIPIGTSFLLASPSESPVFVRMALSLPLRPAVSTGPVRPEFDGIRLDFSIDFGLRPASRNGICKIPVA